MDSEHDNLTTEIVNTMMTAVDSVLFGEVYHDNQVPGWAKLIAERCLELLLVEMRPRKFIVSAMIVENNGPRPYVATASYWNDESDGSCTVTWKSHAMHCIVSVFILAL